MKKIIILLIMMFCLTGCSLNTELNFKNNKVNTNITGNFTKKDFANYYSLSVNNIDTEINKTINSMIVRATIDNEFNKTISNDNDNFQINLSYDFTYDEFNNDNQQFKACFDSYTVVEKEDFYYYDISGSYNCDFKPTLIVTSENGVGTNNADSVKNGKYIWNIKESENDITFTIYKNSQSDNGNSLNIIRIILFIIVSISTLIMIFVLRKQNNI